MDDYELYHYGVKGMKWGVIRWKDKLGYGRLHKKSSKYEAKIEKQLSKKHINEKKLKKYKYKKDQIQKAMNRKYSDLTPEEKKQGARAYSKISKIAKGLGIFGLGVGVGALAQNIADNGGIRKEFEANDDKTITLDYDIHYNPETKIGDEVTATTIGRNALAIGKWIIPYGDYDNAIGTANISSISDTGRVTGYTNFKPR